MKKIFTLALSAVAALSINAADLTPGYVCGEIGALAGTDKDSYALDGTLNSWVPESSLDIAQIEEGVYEGEFWLEGYFAFSTVKAEWDNGYNENRWCLTSGESCTSGETMYITTGTKAFTLPSTPTAIRVTIDLNEETIVVTDLVNGQVEEVKDPALTGSIAALNMNWDAPMAFEKSENSWVLNFADGLALTTSDMIKICDANGKWTAVNFGGNGDAIALDTEYALVAGGDGQNIVPAVDMTVKSIVVVLSDDLTSGTLTLKSEAAAIEDIEIDSNEAVEYYNLQGVKVNGELPAGLYIAKQGVKTSKVIVK